jgi:hypothetical protein
MSIAGRKKCEKTSKKIAFEVDFPELQRIFPAETVRRESNGAKPVCFPGMTRKKVDFSGGGGYIKQMAMSYFIR